MGYYIETGSSSGKAEWIKLNASGIYLTGRPTEVNPEFVPVCVVDNGQFEAAAIAFCPKTAEGFDMKSDKRPKTWILIPVSEAVRLCPKVGGKIDWGNT